MKLNRSINAVIALLAGTTMLRLWVGNAQGPTIPICNCDNRSSDWYFESLDSGSSIAGKLNDDFLIK